ncbi:MAG: hypothetical protein LBO66_06755 [Deltaproteobacteria bacterium]|jgi:ribosome maturation factor RimP|nr:hypothetical protein [Deltaproteobacteria bacterium]
MVAKPKKTTESRRERPAPRFPGDFAELVAAIRAKASRLAAKMGLELGELETPNLGSRQLFRVVLDRPPTEGESYPPGVGSQVSLRECVAFTQKFSPLLELIYPEEGPGYTLEVSSPGLDRRLRSETALIRHLGSLAKIKLRRGENNLNLLGRVFRDGESFRLEPEARVLPKAPRKKADRASKPPEAGPEPVVFAWEEVVLAKLVPEFWKGKSADDDAPEGDAG